MVYVYPNTISTFIGDEAIAIANGYKKVSDSDYEDLVETKLMWVNGELVEDTTYPQRKEEQEEEEERQRQQKIITDEIYSLKSWFDNSYRKYNEMLTRFSALEIQETIYDATREKEYHNLNELYQEAEVVRARIQELEN